MTGIREIQNWFELIIQFSINSVELFCIGVANLLVFIFFCHFSVDLVSTKFQEIQFLFEICFSNKFRELPSVTLHTRIEVFLSKIFEFDKS